MMYDVHCFRDRSTSVLSDDWLQTSCAAAQEILYGLQVISVDNVLVRPGDYILADDDGVVVIPMGVAPKIAELAIECVLQLVSSSSI